MQPRARRSASAGISGDRGVRPRRRPPQKVCAIALLLRIGRRCPGRLRGRQIGHTLFPRARATPSAGLDSGARLRAHPGRPWTPMASGCGEAGALRRRGATNSGKCGGLRECIHTLRECIHGLRECINRLRECINRLRECIHTLWECIHRLRECINRLRECIHTLLECIHTLWECIHTLWECIHRLRECIHTLWECIHTLRECIHTLQESADLPLLAVQDHLIAGCRSPLAVRKVRAAPATPAASFPDTASSRPRRTRRSTRRGARGGRRPARAARASAARRRSRRSPRPDTRAPRRRNAAAAP